ncbi:MAG: YfcE family phosphodiesterase [Dehalococcoidia bacterium]|nr:YfcE family phosphodiesterase [Dehalococcoidia bacterium]
MRIGLIADTHIPEAGPELPAQVYQFFRDVDLILHAGDMHTLDVLDWLGRMAPVLGARGNGDHLSSASKYRPGVPPDPRVEDVHILQIERLRVGLIHAFPLPEEVPWRTLEELLELHFGGPVDVVVCGDTHQARIDRLPGLLMINPGSPTLPNQVAGHPGSVGLLEVHGGEAKALLVQLD